MIIGLGTGRSGTSSLSKQLGIGHETAYAFPTVSQKELDNIYEMFQKKGGDVSFTNIHIAERLHEMNPDIRFIHVTRDKEATVKSIVQYIKLWEARQQISPWQTYFPFFNFKDPESVAKYVDWYTEKVLELPFDVEVIPVENLEVHIK